MNLPTVIADAPGAALIGGGFIGPVHVEALRRIGVTPVGVLGSSPEKAERTARELGIRRVYRDIDELLADPLAGVVHVASPNAHHFEQVTRVLQSGRHVICEKPLANSSEETRSLLELSGARTGQAAAVNYNVRYYPICREIRERIRRGDLGRLLSITGSYVQDWLLYPEDYNWRVEPGGPANLRAIADIGTHWMDLAQFVSGESIREVCADIATFHPRRVRPLGSSETFTGSSGRAAPAAEEVGVKTEDYGAILLRFEKGARGVFHVSQASAGRKNRLTIEIAGSLGSAAWDSESPNQLWLGSRKGANQVLERDSALLSAAAAPFTHYPGGHAEGFPDTFKQLYLDVYRFITAGLKAGLPPEFPNFADGDREVRLCEAIGKSARSRQWAVIDEDRLA
jgi:predicted dehydrogenase